MPAVISTDELGAAGLSRARELTRQALDVIHIRTDRLFAALFLFQWFAGIAVALWISPRTWSGAWSSVHPHVWAAVALGGAIISLPLYLILTRPGEALTRHVVAAGQMLFAGLLIHLTGGRIETHFHIFGSLAFLSFYRDWRVLVTSSAVTALDHFLRGLYWPESVYGVSSGAEWRWVEHACWVAFLDVFLGYACWQSRGDLQATSERQALVEQAHETVEHQVLQRTEELRASESRFRTLADSAPVGIFQFDTQGVCVYRNPRYREIADLPAERASRREWFDAVHPEDQAQVRSSWERARNAGSEFALEHRFRAADGRVCWVAALAVPLRDEAGAVTGYLGTLTDVTQRREGEESLREMQERLRSAFDDAAIGMALVAPDGRFLKVNGALCEIVGYSREELLALRFQDLTHPDDLAEDLGLVDKVLQGTINTYHMEKRYFHKQGHVVWAGLDVSLVRDASGAPLHFVSQIQDVTARKRVEAELQQAKEGAEAANRAKSEFLANMSHEIRTPMNGVLGMTALVLDTELSHDQREMLSLVKSSGDALLDLINEILDFSKIEAGHLELDAEEFQLRESLGETLKTLALRAHNKGLELICDIPPDVPDLVVGDAGRLRQVLMNLIGNAVKFTESGEVAVRAELESQSPTETLVRFSVTDTGIGIPAEKLKLIFDPFTQADASTTRRYGGTGLGLTISSRLVGLMGGQLCVESTVGIGSRFHFDVRFGRAAGSHSRALPPKPASLQGVPILIVDDNATNRRVLEESLRHWGARPRAVDSGPAALEELRRAAGAGEPYLLLLLDALMPDMDGFMLAERVLREPDLACPSLMMLSSADCQADARRCGSLGLAAYLVKPIRPAELQRAVARVLGAAAADRRPADAPTPEPARAGAVRRLRILVAEDNAVNQRVIVRTLEREGHSPRVAGNGAEALEALRLETFDLILMDVQMPEMDGFEATAAIRSGEVPTGGHIPIIAMTAHAMKGDRERCLAAGMDDYVSKPVQADDLRKAIERAVAAPEEAVEQPAVAESVQVIDVAAALESVGGDEEFLNEVFGLFRDDGRRLMGEIREVVARGDANALRRAAHALKGSAGCVRAGLLQGQAQKLELMGAGGDLTGVQESLAQLEREFGRVMAALGSGLKGLAVPTT